MTDKELLDVLREPRSPTDPALREVSLSQIRRLGRRVVSVLTPQGWRLVKSGPRGVY